MDFGLSFLPDSSPAVKSASEYFNEAITLSILADKYGLKTIKMTEHYLHSYGGYCPSPLMFLSAIASRTQQIRLMTGCILPAFHHPIQIAATTAMLDAISGGRLDVGFARAYLPYEFDALNISIDESRERFIETVSAVLALWTGKKVSLETKFFKFKDALSLPEVTQQPYPPVWIAAVNSRQSFAWAGEKGFGLLVTPPMSGSINDLASYLDIYRSSFFENKANNTKKPKIALSVPLLIARDSLKAYKESDIYLQHYLDTWVDATNSWSNVKSNNYPGYTGMANFLKSSTPNSMRNNIRALVGEPKEIIEKIVFIRESLNIDQILWQIDFGGQPLEVSKRSLELFINNVLPYL